jgi:hypothetical protein
MIRLITLILFEYSSPPYNQILKLNTKLFFSLSIKRLIYGFIERCINTAPPLQKDCLRITAEKHSLTEKSMLLMEAPYKKCDLRTHSNYNRCFAEHAYLYE